MRALAVSCRAVGRVAGVTLPSRVRTPHPAAADPLNRVAEPGPSFWVVKVLTTGMGETTSDFLVRRFAPELVVPVAFVALVVLLLLQLRTRGYRPGMYWTTALMVSIFGTMAADVLHVGAGVPYAASTLFFAVVLAGVFLVWRRVEGTLSVHEITTARRERFYWATVVTTFALGTAFGDFTANSLHLGYLGSGIGFAVLFAIPGLVHASTRRFAIGTFWAAYVMTRPLGASFADWVAVPAARGGLDLGTGPVSLALLAVFAVLVGLLSVAHRRTRAAS